jgi:hypothetical protein
MNGIVDDLVTIIKRSRMYLSGIVLLKRLNNIFYSHFIVLYGKEKERTHYYASPEPFHHY